MVAAAALVTACGGSASRAASASPLYPSTGLVLLGLSHGANRSSVTVGTDPVAVTVAEDGRHAYVADSSPGDVYAVRLPDLAVAWKQHVGGAPFGLLLLGGHLFVSLFDSAAVVELDPSSGAQLATYAVDENPAVMTADQLGRVVVATRNSRLDRLDGTSVLSGSGFAVALAGGTLWTAGYERSELVPAGGGGIVSLPLPVSPFWLAPGTEGKLLIAAEGRSEDSDPGAVLSYDPMSSSFATLARPRDPDQVLQSGSTIFVAAHGDRDVLAIRSTGVEEWAPGAAAVALAADPSLDLLVVLVNAHE